MFACRLCSNLGSKIVQTPKSLASMLKNIVSYPPLTHAFLKWPFLTDFKKYTHTPPYGMKFWCSGRKMEKTLKIHEFAPRWHILNVPERYVVTFNHQGLVNERSSCGKTPLMVAGYYTQKEVFLPRGIRCAIKGQGNSITEMLTT